MNTFDKEFAMNMFLDDDNFSSMNRILVSVTKLVNENTEIITRISDVIKDELEESSVDSSSYDDKIDRPNKNYHNQIIYKFTDEDYIKGFKMKGNTIRALINFLKDYITPGTIALDKKVHVFLWLLVNGCSYTECGELFGLHKSSVSYIFYEIATQLNEQKHHFVSWPSQEKQHVTRIKVNSMFKFPNCIGFIDVCRFKVGTIKNRRHKPKIALLQAICDETLKFIHFHVAEIGCSKKNRIFKQSKLSQELKKYVSFENHILGDSDYKLRNNLITPFTTEELLTSEDMKFNETHRKAHRYICHAFELLKERFKKLNHIDVVKDEFVHLLITAACVIHNFILTHEGYSEIKEEIVTCDDVVTINTSIVQTAHEKRQFLCNYINFIDIDIEESSKP